MNALTGGTRGAYGKFELDYWSLAATEGYGGSSAGSTMIRPFGQPTVRRAF
jgi:hypothetical protein